MVASIVLFAFGLETTLHDVGDPLRIVPALGLCGGIALYMLAHVALRLRIGGGLGRGRPIATVLLLGLVPVARMVPALTAFGLVVAVCAALIGYEAIRYREGAPGSAAVEARSPWKKPPVREAAKAAGGTAVLAGVRTDEAGAAGQEVWVHARHWGRVGLRSKDLRSLRYLEEPSAPRGA